MNDHKNNSAVATLKRLGYTYKGEEQWAPPIGNPYDFITDDAFKKLIYCCDGMSCEYSEENYGNAREWMRHIFSAYKEYDEALDDEKSGQPIMYTREMSESEALPPIGSKAYCTYDQEIHYIVAHDHTEYPSMALSVGDGGYGGADSCHWLSLEEGEEING